ncbi:cysteine hydrolase family protein [Cesiribacter sp. SM1]|uniref:cysteine hydrolase family protein n=1 Tax=Cesiribacter sp. SM1 TaxID=2861196 RepID=UPI001CD4D9D7|nr:cysteine hydrolase family protein [Cesiribacter sp. SM1]
MKTAATALLLIDVQQGFYNESYWGGNRNNPGAEANISKLLTHWRMQGLPVIHVKHDSVNPASPLHPSSTGNNFMDCALPQAGEPLFPKQVNSAFIGTRLQEYLDENGITSLLIVGLITNHCVSTTARMAANFGYEVCVAEDATATFDRISFDGTLYKAQDVHNISLANLHEEFATIVKTEDMILQHTNILSHA